jgi:hypothetical protein
MSKSSQIQGEIGRIQVLEEMYNAIACLYGQTLIDVLNMDNRKYEKSIEIIQFTIKEQKAVVGYLYLKTYVAMLSSSIRYYHNGKTLGS